MEDQTCVVTGSSRGIGRGIALELAEHGADVMVMNGGRLPEVRPSTIVGCGPRTRLLREGAVSRSDVERVVSLE